LIIRHEKTNDTGLHQLGYVWTPDGLVASIVEIDEEGHESTTSFTYDNRNRLWQEVRTGQHPYSLAYGYDLAGNRTEKVDYANGRVTDYTYDVSSPGTYGSQGNRLMSSVTTRQSDQVVLERRWYCYDLIGNPELVIREIAEDEDELGHQWFRGTRLYYTKDGHLWLSRAEQWQYQDGEGYDCGAGVPPEGCSPVNCTAYAAMEYRYQGGRGRYMVRPRDPETMGLYPYTAADGQWFDYDGQEIYGDYRVSYDEQTQQWVATNTLAHEPGMAQYDNASGELHHRHDQGSSMNHMATTSSHEHDSTRSTRGDDLTLTFG